MIGIVLIFAPFNQCVHTFAIASGYDIMAVWSTSSIALLFFQNFFPFSFSFFKQIFIPCFNFIRCEFCIQPDHWQQYLDSFDSRVAFIVWQNYCFRKSWPNSKLFKENNGTREVVNLSENQLYRELTVYLYLVELLRILDNLDTSETIDLATDQCHIACCRTFYWTHTHIYIYELARMPENIPIDWFLNKVTISSWMIRNA